MKRTTTLLLMSLLSILPAATQAEECCWEDDTSFYAKLFTGLNFLQNTSIGQTKSTYKAGYVVSGALGYQFCSDFRTEIEYAYRRNTISTIHFASQGTSKHGHFRTSSVMGNLLWDVPYCFCEIKPFIGAGIGYDFQKMHSSNSRILYDQKWNHFSWQLMTGLSYELFCNTEVTLEYRYHQGGCHFNNHSLGVGLVYNFDLY